MNSFLPHKIFFSVLCFFTTSSLFCAEVPGEGPKEITAVSVRPVVQGEIYFDRNYKCAMYAGTAHHEKLTKMGIPSCIENPLMPVIIMGKGQTGNKVDWADVIPDPIQVFEFAQCKAQGIAINEAIMRELEQKKLPGSIPAIYLYYATTGTILSFTIHNYPVQLTCCDDPVTKESFKESFESNIAAFVDKPVYTLHHFVDPKEELVEHELIKEVQNESSTALVHGNKGFDSMEKLTKKFQEQLIRNFIVPLGKNAEIILLLLSFLQRN